MSRDPDVIYNRTHPATILAVNKDGTVRVKFKDSNLIPPEMEVPSHLLEIVTDWGTKPFTNARYFCPYDNVPWKETLGFTHIWFDCPVCGAKRDSFYSESENSK